MMLIWFIDNMESINMPVDDIQFTSEKICAGEYEIKFKEYTVSISRHEHLGNMWVASANWDRFLYTDPVYSKKEAVRNAKEMISNTIKEHN